MSRFLLLLLVGAGLAMAAGPPRLNYPDYFPAPVYHSAANPLTEAGIELGRRLFYDPVLSLDGTISCASCHSPYNAFAHTDHDLSHGIGDSIGRRNAPALFNLAWQRDFHWDGAVNHLDVQALAPIEHPGEMGEDFVRVIQKLAADDGYRHLFASAFGSSEISGARALRALAQFQLTLISAGSRYDALRRGEAEFTARETAGYALFRRHCDACHREPLFSTYGFADNGLPLDSTLQDVGRAGVTGRPEDSLRFKIPSLRNLGFTSPYMHDGRFRRLSQVIGHYTAGLVRRPGLDENLRAPILLTDRERVDLVAFLLTLDDRDFVFDPRHQFPRN